MKMVKSLLLGSAAGVVAVAGAQAADLPVKAKPVEYVKVCSLYGAGYYYIPGTDICAKIGGYVRHEESFNFGGDATVGPWDATTTNGQRSGFNSWTDANDFIRRLRAYITMETRQQTQYGTLRTYLNVGINFQSPGITLGNSAGGFNANRAFIQIAGFTMGRAVSYYDYYSAPATSYFAPPSSDAGDGGVIVFAYTAQFGNGFSGSISLEDPRRTADVNVGNGQSVTTFGAFTGVPGGGTLTYKKQVMPDIIANLRVDQAWGGAQIMGAIHDASPGYYISSGDATAVIGHPGEKLGWAVGAGVKINTPFISPGDYLQAQVNYAQGATKYVAVSLGSGSPFARSGSTFGYGIISDGVYSSASNSTGTSLELTTAWGVNVAYEHFWTPAVRTSWYGSYTKFQYNATANAYMCSNTFGGGAAGTALLAGCQSDYAWWTVGSRSQWNVTKDFYLGVDVIYMKLETASRGATVTNVAAVGSLPGGVYTVDDQSIFGFRFRAHRDIVP